MYNYTTRLEVNIPNNASGADIDGLATFVIKNRIPTIIIGPGLARIALMERMRYRGQYKVICAIDFPDGAHFAVEKMRDITSEALSVDGYEVMLSKRRSNKESLNELRAISEFIHKTIDPTKEIRWALGLSRRSADGSFNDFINIMPHFKSCPAAFIRNDNNLVVPNQKVETLIEQIKFIKSHVGTPVKLCGNINLDVMTKTMNLVGRYDVSILQAKEILRQIAKAESAPKVEPVKTQESTQEMD